MNNYHTGIIYKVGSATQPKVPGQKIIAHICNDVGAWGRGFVYQLTLELPVSEHAYRNWYQMNEGYDSQPCALGRVQFVKINDELHVANMVAQTGILPKDGVQPIRYHALETCLRELAAFANKHAASVHMPRIGCGLAGGSWKDVEKIINDTLIKSKVPTYVYDLQGNDGRFVPWNK